MKVVRVFSLAFEAEFAAGYLENEGINAQVFNSDSSFTTFGGASPMYTARVCVNDEDYDRAVEALARRDEDLASDLEQEAMSAEYEG